MAWDFAEANPLSDIAASLETAMMRVADVLARVPAVGSGAIATKDAATNGFIEGVAFATDPPYYDNIGYADLSDFFYVWLRRSLRSIQTELFRRVITPKTDELVATPYRHGGKTSAEAFFLQGMKKALAGIAKASADLPATIFYAFKQSELSEEGVTSGPLGMDLARNPTRANAADGYAHNLGLVGKCTLLHRGCRCRPAD
jgi:putative DNA methylase